jgi:hypothetical protein
MEREDGAGASGSGAYDPPSLQMSNLTRIYLLPSDATDAEYLDAYFHEHGTRFREAWRKL